MKDELVNIAQLSRELKLSVRWLRKETDAGRIPHLQAGRDILYNLYAVRKTLAKRASEGKPMNFDAELKETICTT